MFWGGHPRMAPGPAVRWAAVAAAPPQVGAAPAAAPATAALMCGPAAAGVPLATAAQMPAAAGAPQATAERRSAQAEPLALGQALQRVVPRSGRTGCCVSAPQAGLPLLQPSRAPPGRVQVQVLALQPLQPALPGLCPAPLLLLRLATAPALLPAAGPLLAQGQGQRPLGWLGPRHQPALAASQG